MDILTVAESLSRREVGREAWRAIRAAKRRAWIALYEHEDEGARLVVNALSVGTNRQERVRNLRWRILQRALQSVSPSIRTLEKGSYLDVRGMTV